VSPFCQLDAFFDDWTISVMFLFCPNFPGYVYAMFDMLLVKTDNPCVGFFAFMYWFPNCWGSKAKQSYFFMNDVQHY